MASFLFQDTLSFFPPNPDIKTPASGSVMRVAQSAIIAGTATLAALTVMLPQPIATGMKAVIYPNVAVTALTVQNVAGAAVAGAPTAAVAGKPITFLWTGSVWQAEVD